ncbi:carboxypeptidase-like regulatory domain-containing protein [Puia dinghuensis]|uniref:Carboxypeptidase-like regulatory domain-containing protein n=1 Tax=Puia dinghuensis TaxID=1792502 RepID=A0A8J2XRV0_9BACT|nr:carboxypeptidase-like regulatory domain-containing protein [Puia dinghuensis]GGB04412.1 hypothetical protein GCM10011511_29660 [Puia dinghuensis]
MKRLIYLIMLLLAQISGSAQPGGTLSGTVTDSITGKPLAGVSIYLNNTSKGTVSKNDGAFLLPLPPGTYQLVASAIGYATSITEVNGNRLPASLRLKLRPQATELAAITVEPYEKRGWGKYGKFFWNNFIGMGPNASSCSILNKEVLRFHFYKRSNRLSVTATEPLEIENDALGYTLEYNLQEFVSDFNNNIVTYYGYPFFREKTAKNEGKKQTWIRNRRTTYQGSMMHFMRSLYAGHSIREGFLIQQNVVVPNAEKRRIKNIYRPDFQKPGLFPMDTLHYFWEVLRQPDPIQRRIGVSPDTLITTRADQSKGMYFDGTLIVSYGVTSRIDSFRQSGIRLMSAQPITVEENGYYYPSKEILITSGSWSQTEKISNLLPLDYIP